MPIRISFAQNGEDVRVWHAFGPVDADSASGLTYVDVGANYPYELSITAALYELGWAGILVEADPELARELAVARPRDVTVQAVASNTNGIVPFFRVPGTGLGTLDSHEAQEARSRGFRVEECEIAARTLDSILERSLAPGSDIHFMSIDVEGAESLVLGGLDRRKYRPWVMCVEAIAPGTSTTTHDQWEPALVADGYRFVAFDGVNRWYVAEERADALVGLTAGSPTDRTIAEAIAAPFHTLDIGEFGWSTAEVDELRRSSQRGVRRQAWQRELIAHDRTTEVPRQEYERQINELRDALIAVEGSRSFAVSRSVARVGKAGLSVARRLREKVPGKVDERIIRERHLRHVTVNMGHLTDPAFLGHPPTDEVSWVSDRARPPIPPGLQLSARLEPEVVREWLRDYPWDSDANLDARMDNVGDEVGRTRRALRTRLRVTDTVRESGPKHGAGRIAFDARCLQTSAFGRRGIGRFAAAALRATRDAAGDENVTLIVDPGLDELPEDLVGSCDQVPRIKAGEVEAFGALVQPSPMTHNPDVLIPLLSAGIASLAVVFDFIPMHYPTVYLKHVADRAEYAARLDALRHYRQFVCISHVVEGELREVLAVDGSGRTQALTQVAWPREIAEGASVGLPSAERPDGPIVVMTGDEQRKNTFGGLAGVAAATSGDSSRNVVVVGMAGQADRVHHWSIAAAMRPGEAITTDRLSEKELGQLLQRASCVVVPTFDEGLSLPLIEGAQAGAPMVVSDIAAHRELLGNHAGLCDPASPRSVARAVNRAAGNSGLARQQQRALSQHPHRLLEDVIGEFAEEHVGEAEVSLAGIDPQNRTRLRVGVATPWTPQPSGIADFSAAIFTELAKSVDLTVYTTSDAVVTPDLAIEQRLVEEIFEDPEAVEDSHDVVVTVIGNSHFHLPFVQVQEVIEAVTVAHDTRMVEFYLALRGPGGAEQLMLRTADEDAPDSISPALDDQVNDMRLLQNAGLWEVARRARSLVLHTPGALQRIERETGVEATVLPFAHYRGGIPETITPELRSAARDRLGIGWTDPEVIHLATFGYVDVRTKLTDMVVEAAGWLTQWGHRIALHVVGAASPEQERELLVRAQTWGLDFFEVTGFQTEGQFQDWLAAVDLGIQLRVSPLLGVSGPLSDLAAFGTPAVASRGLCVDVAAPEFISRLLDAVSPVTVAEAVEKALAEPWDPETREEQRLAYLERMAPKVYADRLLSVLETATGGRR